MRTALQFVGLCWLTAAGLWATEKNAWLGSADLVVIGTLEIQKHFWFLDGLHVSGRIHVDEVLYGPAEADSSIRYAWRLPCPAYALLGFTNSCRVGNPGDVRSRIKDVLPQRGIWILYKKVGNEWGSPDFDPGLRTLKDRDEVIQILKRREAATASH